MHFPIALRRRSRAAIEWLEQRLCLAATITINQAQTQQTIQALGGDYAEGKYGDFYLPSNDAVGEYTLANLQPKETRIGIPLRGWEETNDNSDPNTINWAGFGTNVAAVNNVFLLMQSLKAEGASITASVWDAPDWMVSNPTATHNRIVPSSEYPELIESIGAFLIRADTVFNVRVDYLSINEPDFGSRLQFSSTQLGSLIAQAGPMFARLGLAYTPKWLVGDTGNASTLVSYATPILQNAAALPYLGPITFHGWNALDFSSSVFSGIVSLAQQYNLPIWCTEVGYDALADQDNPQPFPTWTYAMQIAETYYTVMALGHSSVNDYWEMQDDFPLLQTDPTVLYPSYYIVQTLMQNFTPGVEMITASSTTTPVESMAARDPSTGRLVVYLINTGSSSTQTVTVTGLPAGIAMTQIRSDANDNAVNEGNLTANSSGTFTFSLPPQTVVTLSGTPGFAVIAMQHIYTVSPNQLTFTFNSNVGASAFNLSSLFIATDSGEPPISPTAYSYNSSNNTAIWTLPTNLVNGTYTATLTGPLLSQAVNLNFFSLIGDANHDGIVNATDFSILAANYGKRSGINWNNGDFNYDGTVNALDFNAMATNYGINLFATSSTIPSNDQMLPQSHAMNSSPQTDLFSSQSIDRLDVLGTDAPVI